jgi:hypothetical protein
MVNLALSEQLPVTPLPGLDPHAPPLRVMALHALAYCPRRFSREEVEEIGVADAAVCAGRERHAGREAGEGGEFASFERSSPTLGLTGKIDCRRRDGSYLPGLEKVSGTDPLRIIRNRFLAPYSSSFTSRGS